MTPNHLYYGNNGGLHYGIASEPAPPQVEPDPAVEGCAWYLVGEPGGMWYLTQWNLETGEVQPPGTRTGGPFETAPDAWQWAGQYVAHESFSWNMIVWQRVFRVDPAENPSRERG